MTEIDSELNRSKQLNNSEIFKPDLYLINEDLKHLAIELATAITEKEHPSTKELKAMETVIANLIASHRSISAESLAYSQNNNAYKASSRYNPTGITTAMLKRVMNGLCSHGYIEIKKGFHGRSDGHVGRVSRAIPKKALTKVISTYDKIPVNELIYRKPSPIQLKNEDKSLIEFPSTNKLEEMKANIDTWNEFMSDHYVDLAISAEERCKYIRGEESLYRVFNNNSFEEGGRYYGHWLQSLPSKIRLKATIDGKPVGEIDFKSIHPRLLYSIEGIKLDADYDPYSLDESISRKDAKVIFQILVNSKSESSALRAIRREIKDGNLSSSIDPKQALLS